MQENDTPLERLSLARIESDLLEAEAAYNDADARIREAERDRDAALERINNCQRKFDSAVKALRQRSIPASSWGLQPQTPEATLILQPEQIAKLGDIPEGPSDPIRPYRSMEARLDDLRATSKRRADKTKF